LAKSKSSLNETGVASKGKKGSKESLYYVEKRKVCPKCGSTKIIIDEETGELVCSECGLVISKGLFLEGKDWRAFSTEEFIERARAGAPVSPTRTAYGLDTKIAYSKGLSGKSVRALRRTKKHVRSRKEKRVMPALFKIRAVAERLDLPTHTVEDAARLYRLASSAGLVKGRSMDAMVAAVIYAACRRTEVPRFLEEIASFFELTEKEVGRSFRFLFRKLDVRIPPPKPEIYVSRIVSKLKLPQSIVTRAIKILRIARKVGATLGREPAGTAAGAVYLATQEAGIHRTQRELAQAVSVTEVTVRNRYREFVEKVRPLLRKEEGIEAEAEPESEGGKIEAKVEVEVEAEANSETVTSVPENVN